MRYKPWKGTQHDAWDNQELSDDMLTNCWQEFLQTPYAQTHVPDWFDKLQNVVLSQQEQNEPVEPPSNTHEEWMILSDLHTPFDDNENTPDWQGVDKTWA